MLEDWVNKFGSEKMNEYMKKFEFEPESGIFKLPVGNLLNKIEDFDMLVDFTSSGKCDLNSPLAGTVSKSFDSWKSLRSREYFEHPIKEDDDKDSLSFDDDDNNKEQLITNYLSEIIESINNLQFKIEKINNSSDYIKTSFETRKLQKSKSISKNDLNIINESISSLNVRFEMLMNSIVENNEKNILSNVTDSNNLIKERFDFKNYLLSRKKDILIFVLLFVILVFLIKIF